MIPLTTLADLEKPSGETTALEMCTSATGPIAARAELAERHRAMKDEKERVKAIVQDVGG